MVSPFSTRLSTSDSHEPVLGSLVTTATWIRNFVRSHPQYKFDSVVSQAINYDLLVAVDEMYVPHCSIVEFQFTQVMNDRCSERGVRREPTLLPEDYTGGNKDQGSIGL
jgi:glutamate--cysteine ligase catalytic subunit